MSKCHIVGNHVSRLILRDAVVAASLQPEWNSSQEDAICSNALSDFPTPTQPSICREMSNIGHKALAQCVPAALMV